MLLDGAYINLDRSEARRLVMERQLQDLHCENWIRRFAAIDGTADGPFDNAGQNSIWACRKSHIALIESSDKDSLLLVLEDDVELSRYFASLVNQATMHSFAKAHANTDILFLDCVSFNAQVPFLLAQSDERMKNRLQSGSETERHHFEGVSILDAHGIYAYCTASYVVTPKGKRVLRHLFANEPDSNVPIDILFRDWIAAGRLNANITVPFLATPQFKNESTISYESLQSSSLDEKEGRLANAIRRLLFAGEHRLDMAEVNALIADVSRSPEYDLGMKLYQSFRALHR
ncbi:glycosyltransferase family 25 protein [Caballeronia sp. GAFFF1]|uniref:glycosyltransferase family 25 protein n=1 Tax=Caballeronia sp. GAFFF1 TaxID=2921779 RepID=UPI0020295AB6|nr:glycosyltransferase family 25 protein [Caballeronia sp. GAFFF1]